MFKIKPAVKSTGCLISCQLKLYIYIYFFGHFNNSEVIFDFQLGFVEDVCI